MTLMELLCLQKFDTDTNHVFMLGVLHVTVSGCGRPMSEEPGLMKY